MAEVIDGINLRDKKENFVIVDDYIVIVSLNLVNHVQDEIFKIVQNGNDEPEVNKHQVFIYFEVEENVHVVGNIVIFVERIIDFDCPINYYSVQEVEKI